MGFRLANVDGRAALVVGDDYYDLENASGGRIGSDPMDALASSDQLSDIAAGLSDQAATGRLADAKLGPPSPRPANSFGIGLNYRNHAEEGGMPIPEVPLVFAKFPSCITGPKDDVELRSDFVDYEGELVAIIGKTAKDVSVEDAWGFVAGLCVGQDISDRRLQFSSKPPQFSLGKSATNFGPIGPALVSLDELPDPDAVGLRCWVAGEKMQESNTNNLIFTVPQLIEYISQFCVLYPGDLIFTGTPGGVGSVREPRRYLAPGELIESEMDGIGRLANHCVARG